MRLDYIDISKWQGNLNFKALKPYVDGVMIRAGFGWYNVDPKFSEYVKECKENGIPWGIYFFSYATNLEEAKKEMKGFLNHIKGLKPSLPVAIDMEDDRNYKKNRKVSWQMLADILAFECEEIEKAGYYSMFYTSKSWADILYKKRPDLKNYDLWLAHWYDKRLGPSLSCGIWQYGKRKLLGKTFDANYCYKDYPAIIKNNGLNGFKKPEKSEKEKEPVNPRYLICYVNDGDMAGALALLNALSPISDCELRHGQPEPGETRAVIQVGGAEIEGADVKITGKDRTAVLANLGDFVSKLRG